ncbi:MAG TPA: DNA repair exonuclease, partial [Rhodospirillales bacterium]|nr:DNA repair exonuclease [Rhodospirillales bacterium]
MSIGFIHTADWQLGAPFGFIPGDAGAALREARFAVVQRIAALACERAADAVLVAGDVFDGNAVSEATLSRALDAMAAPFHGPWVLLPGNHDAALAESVWTRLAARRDLPPNVVLATEPRPLALADGRLVVLPAPLRRRHEDADLTGWFDGAATPAGCVRVGLAHGSVEGRLPDGAEIHNPIAADRAARARLDWLALGDWHGTCFLDRRTAYAGTPEPDRFKDNDPGAVLFVRIAAAGS